jgi:hypothetical protein
MYELALRQDSVAKFIDRFLVMHLLVRALSVILFMLCGASVQAQQTPSGFEPLTVVVDPNGVDLLSGRITFPPPTLQAPVVPSLTMTRLQDFTFLLLGQSQPSNPDAGVLVYTANLRVGRATSESFKCIDGDCQSQSPRTGQLIDGFTSGIYFYTEPGTGRVIRYDSKVSKVASANGTSFAYWATNVTYPDGESLALEYDKYQVTTLQTRHRLTAVKSSRGFQLRFNYVTNVTTDPAWGTLTSVGIYRNGNLTTPIASISYTPAGTVDMAGNAWNGTFNSGFGARPDTSAGTYRPPMNSNDQIVAISMARDQKGGLLTRLTKENEIWNYAWSHAPNENGSNNPYQPRTVTITGPLGYSRTVTIGDSRLSSPIIKQETDALGRLIQYTYDNKQRVTKIQYPEGNAVEVIYDNLGNITRKTSMPKAGSGLANIVEEAAYPDNVQCQASMVVTCFRPLWIKDGRGNITNYVWSPDHGMLLKETKPADANGIRPEIRYEYAPYAVWVKVKESFCRSGAASGNPASPCAAGATDEVVTQYDYGPTTGPNDLLVRGMTVTATDGGGVLRTYRTCYGYDGLGRKISETKPAANLTACP